MYAMGNDLITRLRHLGVSRSHAYGIVNGADTPSLKLALKIYESTSERFGDLIALDEGAIQRLIQVRRCRSRRPRVKTVQASPVSTAGADV